MVSPRNNSPIERAGGDISAAVMLTQVARKIPAAGGGQRDVRSLAGHASLRRSGASSRCRPGSPGDASERINLVGRFLTISGTVPNGPFAKQIGELYPSGEG